MSILISIVGFLVTGAVLLVRGEPLTYAAVKSVLAFAVLYSVHRVLGSILVAVSGMGMRPASPTPEPVENRPFGE